MGSRRNVLIILAVLIVVLGAVAFVYWGGNSLEFKNQENTTGENQNPDTWAEVGSNVAVPNTGDQVAENVATPEVIGPAGGNTNSSFREFSIDVQNDTFMPANVIAKKGDTIRINFFAKDKSYQFVQPDYGFNVNLPKGETTPVQFQVTATGKFTFYCEKCGGPQKGPVGYLIVAE